MAFSKYRVVYCKGSLKGQPYNNREVAVYF